MTSPVPPHARTGDVATAIRCFRWSPRHVAAIKAGDAAAPRIGSVDRVLPGIDLWDHWPVTDRDGAIVAFDDGPLVVALTAPILDDPEERHARARLRLLQKSASSWRDHGFLLPDGLNPGSREWAGAAILEPDGRTFSLYYTAAGQRGEDRTGFLQRLMVTQGMLAIDNGAPRVTGWSPPRSIVEPDDTDYQSDMEGGGAVGTIKAFRDPFPFVDPRSGIEYVLFTASRAHSTSAWNGLVGAAQRDGRAWRLLPPLVDADGLNNELERPHIVAHRGRYLLFWSTQARVFAANGPVGPTGLYGLVADDPAGPWRPLNGTGLVIANPPEAPFQAYSWLVNHDLSVWSFADLPRLTRPPETVAKARRAFIGTPAPVLHLAIEGDTARII
jgi:levansucrase